MADPSALEMAKQFGVDGVQVDLGPVEGGLTLRKREVQEKYMALMRKHKIEVASMGIVALSGLPFKSGDPRGTEWVSDAIGACKVLGGKVVLVPFFGPGDLRGDRDGTSVVVDQLILVAPEAEKAGISLGLESWLSAAEHMDIIEQVGSQAVKVYYNVGNSHKAGYDIYKEIRFLGSEHICEFHAKDYGGMFGKGDIDFKRVRRAMDEVGWRGWIQFEGTSWVPNAPLSPQKKAAFRQNIAYLRSVFPPEV